MEGYLWGCLQEVGASIESSIEFDLREDLAVSREMCRHLGPLQPHPTSGSQGEAEVTGLPVCFRSVCWEVFSDPLRTDTAPSLSLYCIPDDNHIV